MPLRQWFCVFLFACTLHIANANECRMPCTLLVLGKCTILRIAKPNTLTQIHCGHTHTHSSFLPLRIQPNEYPKKPIYVLRMVIKPLVDQNHKKNHILRIYFRVARFHRFLRTYLVSQILCQRRSEMFICLLRCNEAVFEFATCGGNENNESHIPTCLNCVNPQRMRWLCRYSTRNRILV